MPRDVKTTMPDLDLQPGATLTVVCDDPGAVISSLVIHVTQTLPPGEAPLPDALLAHLPTNA